MSTNTIDAATTAALHAPRILCLHGGGTNATVFRLQCRVLIPALSPHFRLVFVDAPFECPPHPDIVLVYGDFAPFRRWLRWREEHDAMDDDKVTDVTEATLKAAMDADEGSGEWVGLLGFSQGAKLAASMLYDRQLRMVRAGTFDESSLDDGHQKNGYQPTLGMGGIAWKFAVIMAGRAPLVAFDKKCRDDTENYVRPGGKTEWVKSEAKGEGMEAGKLRLPSIHVHGLQDDGLQLHRDLYDVYCDKGSKTLVEWDGEHRIPLKTADVKLVVDAILAVGNVDRL